MSHYREINRELVDEVRKMRKEIKLCRDEIIHLKGELLEKHESEVLLRKQCYNWAVKNFVQIIQTMQPDSDILPVLKENIQTQEKLYSTSESTEERAPWGSRTSETRRRSSILSRELRRSHSIINLRKSLRSTSPIRRKSEANEEEVERNSHFGQDTEEVGPTETELLENQSLPQPLINSLVDDILYEDTDEEDLDVESIYESIEKVNDTSPIRSPLKDVTNILTATIISSKQENSSTKTTKKKTKTQILNDQDNSTTSGELVTQSYLEQRTTKTAMKHPSRLTDNSVANIEECTLQELRSFSNIGEPSDMNISFPIKRGNNTRKEVTTNSPPTSSYIDMTLLSTFKNIHCSTPNSERNSLLIATTPAKETESVTDFKTTNTTVRPSRRCKPTNLAEERINLKQRNEDTSKPKRKTRSKSKGKK